MGLKERRQREIEERRRQILAAAKKVLFERGMRHASIKKIAQIAEVGVGTIYFYFKNKEALFIALQEEGLMLLSDRIQKASSHSDDPIANLQGIADAYLTFSETEKDYFDILNYFISTPDIVFESTLKQQIDEHGAQILARVIHAIDAGVRQKIFKKVDGRRYAVAFWGLLHGILHFKKMEKTILFGENFSSLYQASVETFIKGLASEGN